MNYTPQDNPKKVYRYIKPNRKMYRVVKTINGKIEDFGTFTNIIDAIHERDLLESVDWDIDLLCEIPLSKPGFTMKDLPPLPRNLKQKKVWVARIKHNYHHTSLGSFNDPLSAEIVYKLVKEEIHGVKV